MLSREWRCSWSSADRRCSNYIWVIDNFIAYWGASYIRDFTVFESWAHKPFVRRDPDDPATDQSWAIHGLVGGWQIVRKSDKVASCLDRHDDWQLICKTRAINTQVFCTWKISVRTFKGFGSYSANNITYFCPCCKRIYVFSLNIFLEIKKIMHSDT